MPQRAALEPAEVLNHLIEVVAEALIVSDERFTIQFFNQAAERIFGYTPEEMREQNLERLLPEPFSAAERIHARELATVRESSPYLWSERMSLWGKRKDGQQFPVEAMLVELPYTAQRYFAVVLRDLSERELQKQRDQNEAMQVTLRTLANIITTDLNLLNCMCLYKTEAQPLNREEIQECSKIITHALRHIQQMLALESFATHQITPEVKALAYTPPVYGS